MTEPKQDVTYQGHNLEPTYGTSGENVVTIITVTPPPTKRAKIMRQLSPKPSQKLRNHSPTGFSWGYGGSGPAQLALAILLDYTSDPDFALRHYQDFKWDVIARLPQGEDWELTSEQLRVWCERATELPQGR